ncbi:MAG TPA: family 1 glycosylhydrolase [Chthoniobacteraceae bacterium]|jgi:beta-glucosidase/6-phospho-beta-glucosidase/beta-galactosidase
MSEFLWGVATSAYQAEGGYNGAGEPQTNWATAEAAGDVAVVGAAADFWTMYEEDFARCRDLGLNAFRLGIEWSRFQPTRADQRGEPPPFDFAAIDHYAAIFASCQQHGLEPVVTLHHFVHPAWLGADAWLDETTPELFAAYVRTAVARVNERLERPLHWFITINEPNMLVLNSYLGRQFPAKGRSGFDTMFAAYNQLLRAHVLAYNALHDLYQERGWPAPAVSFNNYCSDLYWSDKLLLDLVAARERGVPREGIAAHICQQAHAFEAAFSAARIPLHRDLAYYFGSLLKRLSNWIGYRRFDVHQLDALLDTIYASPRARLLDYIGLDYYDPFAAHAFRLPVFWDHEFKSRSFRSWMLATVTSKWWDWRVLPRGLHFFCEYYARDFDRPVLIAENGMALRRREGQSGPRRDRMTRSQFLRLHVHEVSKIVRSGVPLLGYLHWSLFDNYEWGTYTPRFGLYSIDFLHSTDRLAEDPTGDRPADTYAKLIREAREKTAAG